jgi:hypothetical protein
LRKEKRDAWHFLLAGDESWFFYDGPHQKLWIPPDVETLEGARWLIDTSEHMVTIFWSASGIQVIHFLPSGEPFNSGHFIERILPNSVGLPARHDAVRQKKAFVLHMDNSPIHKSKAVMDEMATIPVQLAPHPY